MALQIDIYTESINKYGEELCGNKTEIIRTPNGITAVLADGPGCGVKANMLASLNIKMIISMLGRGERFIDAVETVVGTQPLGTRDTYSAFTLVQISSEGLAQIAEVDMPGSILLRRGRLIEIPMDAKVIGRSIMREGSISLRPGDILTITNKGIIEAGRGSTLETGWSRELVAAYLQAAYKPRVTAVKLTKILLSASSSLDLDKPADDLTVITFRAGNIT